MYGEPGKQKDEIVPSHRHGSHYVTLQRAVLAQGPGRAGSEGKQSQKARDPLMRRRVSGSHVEMEGARGALALTHASP